MTGFTETVVEAYSKQGFSNRTFAKAIGLSHQYVYEILTGRIPAEGVILKIADVLGLDRKDLLLLAREERADSPEAAEIYAQARLDIPMMVEAHEVSDKGAAGNDVPIIAYVSAGEPLECAWTDAGLPVGAALEWTPAPPEGKAKPGMYALKVKGTSMLPIIKPGAILYVDPHAEVNNYDLVVARDEDHAWIKQVRFSGDHIILKSLNPEFEDIVTSVEKLLLLHPVVWFKTR